MRLRLLKQNWSGVILVALLTTALTVSACGKKGDPVRPGDVKKEKKE